MNRGKEEDKLSPMDFEVEHNEKRGCWVELVDLGKCLGLNKEGKRTELPVFRLKCVNHEVVSQRFLGESVEISKV